MKATGRSDKYAPIRPSDSQIRASKREYDDGGRPTEVGALLLFPGRYGSATGYRGVKQNGTERWSARFGDGGATNIGSYDHPIEAAVEYALHPEVVASVNSKRRGMRHPGAKPASSAKRQKTTVTLCDQDPRCELARGHDGECSFPNHESYVDSEGLEWALQRSTRNKSGLEGCYPITYQPQGINACAAGAQKKWSAFHVGCAKLGCPIGNPSAYLAGAPEKLDAALCLAKHKASLQQCFTCKDGRDPLGNPIILCKGVLANGHACKRAQRDR